jgi:tetratricopeptide (TPR) repeat protein
LAKVLVTMFKSLFFKILLLVLVVLGVPGGVIGYWYYTSQPSYLLKRGHEALEKAVRAANRESAKAAAKEVERLILLLDKKGYVQAARLLRGESQVYAGEYALKNEGAAFPYAEVQREAQMVLAGAGLSDQPVAIREGAWIASLASLSFQKPFRASSSSYDYYRKALADLTKIQDDGPIGIKGTVLAAECLMRLGEQRLAAEGLTAILKRDPENKDAHRFLAAIYIDLNSRKDAVEHLMEWGRLDPSDGLPYRWIGFFKKENNEVSSAREAYETALQRQLRPDVKNDVFKELADTYILQGDYQLALGTLEQGGEDFLEAPEILAIRVECLRTTDRQKEAEQLVASALEKDPNFVPGLLLLAEKFRTEDQPKRALPLLERAIKQEPHNLRVGTQLMEVYLQVGDPVRANELKKLNDETRQMAQELREKLEPQANSEPWNDVIRLKIGEMYLKLGRPADARMWLESCLACNPNNSRARQLINQIPRKGDLKGRPSAGSF